jgi:hypothetical protein
MTHNEFAPSFTHTYSPIHFRFPVTNVTEGNRETTENIGRRISGLQAHWPKQKSGQV